MAKVKKIIILILILMLFLVTWVIGLKVELEYNHSPLDDWLNDNSDIYWFYFHASCPILYPECIKKIEREDGEWKWMFYPSTH